MALQIKGLGMVADVIVDERSYEIVGVIVTWL